MCWYHLFERHVITLPLEHTAWSNMVGQFLISFPLYHSVKEAWGSSLLFHSSRPHHCFNPGLGPGTVEAAEAKAEGRGNRKLKVKVAAATVGQRQMNNTPKDQSSTRNHSRSSFLSGITAAQSCPCPHKPHYSTAYKALFFFFARSIEMSRLRRMRTETWEEKWAPEEARERERGWGGGEWME